MSVVYLPLLPLAEHVADAAAVWLCILLITEHQVSTATAGCIACVMGHHCAGMSAVFTFVFQADEECSGQASEHKRIFGTVLADCRHVHYWQQLFYVVQQQLVE